MIIKNADVFTEEGTFVLKDIYIEGNLFAEQAGGEVIDGAGCYAIPGLVDIHFHGCVGYDFCDGTKEAIDAMAEYEASQGVTAIVPATMTLGRDTLKQICETAGAYGNDNEKGAELCGINMEGPFISMEKKGAQNPLYIHKPDVEMFRELNEASGNMVKLVALAPEEEGAMEFIDALVNEDKVVVSVAHTTADAEITAEALRRGASHVTHLYNAMPPFHHRKPGVVGAACDDENCEVELICDGIHIAPEMVRATFKMFGRDRIILISDSMMATGMPDGTYSLGGQVVIVKGNLATLEDGTIAGSNTNLMNCMKTVVQKMKLPLETAVLCASRNPAKSVGIYDRYGSIRPGKVASMVLLDKKDLSVKQVILRGKLL